MRLVNSTPLSKALSSLVLFLFCAVLLSACGEHVPPTTIVYPPNADTSNLQDLKELRQYHISKKDAKKKVSPIRTEALKEAALTVGAQGALAKRSQEVDDILKADTPQLDKVFRFQALMLDHNVLPPVLQEGDNLLNLDGSNTIRLADKTYKIVQQAKFVTAPPTWRDYIWLTYKKPEVPDKTMLPKNFEELAVWQHYVTIGWHQGTQQANDIFGDNLARLKRDYEGMSLYHKLLDENMISKPYVAKTKLGITGGPSKITINDQLLRITALPKLNPKGSQWTPILAKPFTSSHD